MGRGAAGRLLSFTLPLGRKLEFRLSVRFTFAFGTLTFPGALTLARFTFAGRLLFAFVLPIVLAFAFSFAFLFFGRFGLFSFEFDAAFALRLSLVFSSSGVTGSGDSPSLVGRLRSIATV